MQITFTRLVLVFLVPFLFINSLVAQIRLVKDIYPGFNSSVPVLMGTANGKVVFAASNPEVGRELWASDGTPEGTTLLKDIRTTITGAFGLIPHCATLNGTIYFGAGDDLSGTELWKTNGTPEGTELVLDIEPGKYQSRPEHLTTVGNKIFFSAYNRTSNKRELWITDGSATGTRKVIEVNISSITSSPTRFVAHQNKVFFTADNGSQGLELWVSDGTTAGTFMVADINPTSGQGSNPEGLAVYGNQLLFEANDGVHGKELWITDGIATGTRLVKDIYRNNVTPPTDVAQIAEITTLHDKAFFITNDNPNGGGGLWLTDGTTEGTRVFMPASDVSNLVVIDQMLYFGASTGTGDYGIWKCDGNSSMCQLIKRFDTMPFNLNVANDALLFITEGNTFWRSNGTAEGTYSIGALDANIINSSQFYFTQLHDNKFFFSGISNNGEMQDMELWVYENTLPTSADREASQVDLTYTFTSVEFPFQDENDGDALSKLKITQLPTAGNLLFKGENITINQEILASEIGQLAYILPTGISGDFSNGFRFLVSDGMNYSASDYAFILKTVVTGASEETQQHVSVFPVPSQGVYTVKTEQPIKSLQVYSLTGQLVHQEDNYANRNEGRLTLGHTVKAGTYLLCITTSAGIINKRIIKQ